MKLTPDITFLTEAEHADHAFRNPQISTSEKAITILQKTNDGDDLAPRHLSLLESAVNGFLTPEGIKAFDTLYEQIESGPYVKPWLFDVENVTMDNQGYVYWREIQVEHFTIWNDDSRERLRRYTSEEIAPACLALEAQGIPVNYPAMSAQFDVMRKGTITLGGEIK